MRIQGSSAPTSPCSWISARRIPPPASSWRAPWTTPAPGRAAAWPPTNGPTRRSSASCRAACTWICAWNAPGDCARSRTSRWPRAAGASAATASAAIPWARITRSCSRRSARWPGPVRTTGRATLMGVGNPTTLVRAVREGVDMFDCVLPPPPTWAPRSPAPAA